MFRRSNAIFRSSRRAWSTLLLLAVAAWTIDSTSFSTPAFAQAEDAAAPTKPVQKPPRRPRAQSQNAPAPAAAAAEAAPSGPAVSNEPFAKHAADAGVKSCAATYAGLGKMLTDGSQFVVQTQTGKTEADRHAMQGIVGMAYNSKNYAGPAAGLVFAAPTSLGCEGTIVRVVPFQQDCQVVAAQLPQGSQQLQPLAALPFFQLATGGEAILMPSGQSCVVISIVRGGG